ncbi:ATP-binding Cassette (ABC) Superfamily [Phytophthora infestans T30-4]|uniref:ATP-binding Cassette (ABC) Superfamily n=1 Tax=Phytophthora infestans (strain T30-4) TaxID=403677 RepID=D0P2T7_PHYIT|nr:ATP-binding Cassette (ABC) Superfamily [Phytophthora infestans T30-4]EEY57073.1 ATP-binding Cassette (ABC) Superfamily [Phytophthora infestans T30-4]|eukprot:XP_002895381.1 ATP-binding Cassette (ABC) Superfamily [Phytophthora infestans T30-4]
MWYLGFLALCSVLSFGRALTIIESCVRSSQNMHDELFRRVLKAPVTQYFDVTPMGQILNRFSNDLDQMDTMLPQEYQLLLQNVSLAFGALATSSEIKRLEGVTRTPVYNLFSETLSGLATIRAFCMRDNFIELNRRVPLGLTCCQFSLFSSSRSIS